MRRLLRLLLPVIVLVPAIAIGIPASATLPDPPLCTGAYTFTLSSPMTLPGVGPSGSVGFSISPTWSFCTGWTSWSANYPSGYLTGWCGAATGWGQLPDGRWFDVVWAGSSLTIVGAPVGTYTVVPTSLDCAGSGGTPSFVAVGGTTATADACAGSGTMIASPGLSGTSQTSSFGFGITIIGCAVFGSMSAWGSMTGTCTSATGSAMTSDGQYFDVTWIGTLNGAGRLVLTGNVVGVVHAAPNPLISGNNCSTGLLEWLTNAQFAKLR